MPSSPPPAVLPVTTALYSLALPPGDGDLISLAGGITGQRRHVEGAALLVVELASQSGETIMEEDLLGTGLSLSSRFGPFIYIQSDRTDADAFRLHFTVPPGTALRGMGVRLWNSDDPIDLLGLVVTRTVQAPAAPDRATRLAEAAPVRSRPALEPPTARLGSLTVSAETAWLPITNAIGNAITITGGIAGAQSDATGAVLLVAEFSGSINPDTLRAGGLGWLPEHGASVSFQADPGSPGRFSVAFAVPDGARLLRLGVRLGRSEAPVRLSDVAVTRSVVAPNGGELLVNISIDTEALPHRAADDHVARLIHGRIDGQEYGIGLQMRVFRELGIPATFYLECGQCALHGEAPIVDAGKRILNEGFDLQLHLHAEVLARAQHWKWTQPVPPRLDNLDAAETHRAMAYAVERFHAIAGAMPAAFRAGAYLFNPHTLAASAALGIAAHSNYRADQRPNNAFDFEGAAPMRPFRWTNGLYEFPVTLSPEPLSALAPEECWRRILHHAQVNRTWIANVVLHSWSFMHRDANGYHVWRGPALVDALRRFVAIAPAGVRFVAISEVIDMVRDGIVQVPLVMDPSRLVRRLR